MPTTRSPASRLPCRVAVVVLWGVLGFSPGLARAAESGLVHVPIDSAPLRRSLAITGHIADSSTIERLVVFYRTDWSSWRELRLTFTAPDTYEGAIPSEHLTPPNPTFDHGYVDYYIVAFNLSGARSFLFASPAEPHHVRLTLPVAESDDELQAVAEGRAPAGPTSTPEVQNGKISDQEKAALAPPTEPARPEQTQGATRTRESLIFSLTPERMRQLGLRTLVDVAQLLPGVSVSRDVQGFWHVTARGHTNDAEVIVLLDGQRMNNPLDGKVDWEMPLNDVERVEWRLAPEIPLEYGPAFALLSVTSTERDGVGGGGTLGTFSDPFHFNNDSYAAHVLGGHTWGNFRLSGGADFALRAGYLKTVRVDGILRDGAAGQTDDERLGALARLRLEYRFKNGISLYGQLRASYERRSTLIGAVDVLEPESVQVGQVGLAQLGSHGVMGSWEYDAHLFLDEQRTDRNLALFPAEAFVPPLTLPDGLFLRTIAGVTSVGVAVSVNKTFGPLDTLRFGADVQRQAITRFAEGTTPDAGTNLAYHLPGGVSFPEQVPDWATRWIGGPYVENVWRPLKVLTLTTGLRGDLASGLGDFLFLPAARALLALRVAPFLAIRAAGSRTTRLPTFDELLSVIPLPMAFNDGLPSGFDPKRLTRPVTLTTANVGLDAQVGPEANRVLFRVTGFYVLYDDPIEVTTEAQAYHFRNRAPGEQFLGAEGEVRYDWRNVISAFANISYAFGQDRALGDSAPAFSILSEVPALRANGGLVVPLGKVLSLATTVTYGSERRNNVRTVEEIQRSWDIPAYVQLSATIKSAPIGGWAEIGLSVHSITLTGKELDPVARPDRLPGLLPREGTNGELALRAVY